MGRIPDEVIQEIRERADIVSVIGKHVRLKKAGRNHKGVCPFHGDSDPSFNVNPEKGFFYCFGCHKKGDVFSFVTEYEGRSFYEAVRSLAEETGVTIPESSLADTKRAEIKRSERSEMLRLNRIAADFFVEKLRSPDGEPHPYLASRGVSLEIAEKFQLGIAPNDWAQLAERLQHAKVSPAMAETLGLVAKRQKARGYYDRFRDRIMCPITNTAGDIMGFSGRRLSDEPAPGRDDAPPKYINSPESPVYKKSKLLFGLYQARDGIRQAGQIVLVEGNFDVVAMHQAGITETVAPLGTAFTSEQAAMIFRMAGRAVLLYDGDRAGRKATLAALEVLVAHDVEVLIATLPDGQDPDSLAQEKGPEELRKFINKAKPGIEYFIHEVWSRSSASTDSRAQALREAASVLKSMADGTKRDFAIGTFATALGVSETAVRKGLRRALTEGRDHSNQSASVAKSKPAPISGPSAPPARELMALALLADHPSLIETAEELNLLSHLTDPRLRDMYSAARTGSSILDTIPNDPQIAQKVLSGAYTEIASPQKTLREITSVLSKDLALAGLQKQKKSLEPSDERARFQQIVNTRRQVD